MPSKKTAAAVKTGRTSASAWRNGAWRGRQDVLLFVAGWVLLACWVGLLFALPFPRGGASTEKGVSDPHKPEVTAANDPDKILFLTDPDDAEDTPSGNATFDKLHPLREGDGGAQWFYWRLPPNERNWGTVAFAWVPYLFHMVVSFWLLYRLQARKREEHPVVSRRRFAPTIERENIFMLVLHVLMYFLRIIVTFTTFDGLAGSSALPASSASTILGLSTVLVLEIRRRGIFLGWPHPHRRLKLDFIVAPIRVGHGYILLAMGVHTLHFNPTLRLPQFLFGFILVFGFLLQGSLAFTHMHKLRPWRLYVESFVTWHGTSVAIAGGKSALGIGFGFGAVLAFTQIFTIIPLNLQKRWFVKIISPLVWLGMLLVFTAVFNEWAILWRVINNPLGLWGMGFVIMLTVYLVRAGPCGCTRRARSDAERCFPSPGSCGLAIGGLIAAMAIFHFFAIFMSFVLLPSGTAFAFIITLLLIPPSVLAFLGLAGAKGWKITPAPVKPKKEKKPAPSKKNTEADEDEEEKPYDTDEDVSDSDDDSSDDDSSSDDDTSSSSSASAAASDDASSTSDDDSRDSSSASSSASSDHTSSSSE